MSSFRTAVGLFGLENYYGGDFAKVVDLMRRAEDLGIDQMVITDHVVMGERTDRYPYGEFPTPPDYQWFEPIVAMSAIAGATERIRLSTSVLISPLRPPVLLAKQAATLDAISGGRLDLGVGTGWQREEYEASGIPWARRNQRLEDQLRACRALWTESPASFESETVSFDTIHCRPAPRQEPLPIWFGMAPTEANCRRIAELGQGYLPISQDPAVIAEDVRKIREAFERAGRDPGELEVRAQLPPVMGSAGPDLEATMAGLEPALEAGATVIEVLPVIFSRSPDDVNRCLERIAKLKS
ncbi:MAG: LLM class F420-dependent oxidoreductase [bacterium]